MRFYHKKLEIASLTAAFVLAACTSDPAGPDPDVFDAAATEANLAAIDASFDTPAFQSLAALGDEFQVGGAAAAAASANLVADAHMAHRTDFAGRAQIARERIIEVLANASASAPLIPEQWRGLTLVYHPEEEDYIVDEERTGAPEDGIRFILYSVNPITDDIVVPLQEIGYADVIDIGTETSSGVRLVVVSDGVTYVDYDVTATGVFNAPTVTIDGMVTDGTNTIEFTLAHTAQVTFAGATFTVDYDINVVNLDVQVNIHLEVSGDDDGEAAELDVTVTNGANSVNVAGSSNGDDGSFEVRVNTVLFATITTSATGVDVVNADGEPLTEEEVRALTRIMDFLEDAFNAFENFFDPVTWLFEF